MPPALLMTAGLGALQAGGSIIGGIQSQQLANVQAGEYQAQAATTREAGGQQAAAEESRNLGAIHAGVASAASGGTAPLSGSAGVLARTNTSKTIEQSMMTRYGANLQASQDIAEAAVSRFQGSQAMLGGILGAGTSLLTAGLRGYGIQKGLPGSTLIF